jgi:hypothetical protein
MSNSPNIYNTLNTLSKNILSIDNLFINDMCNSKYIYTLNSYRNSLIKESRTHNINLQIVDEYILKLINNEYFPEVENRIKYIESIPLVEQKTPEWFKLREGMISASDAGYFLKKCGASKAVDSLKIKVGLKSYCNSTAPPLMHGNTYEDVSRAIYESRNSVSVTEYGILSSPTACIGASPDGIVTKCYKDTYESQSKFGRLLEIKNPYSREIDNTIKPEYMVQILQQQYTTQLPICDFVETTIVDKFCHTFTSKPYENLAEMLEDKIDKTNSTWESRVKNNNIPVDNLNKFGNEKGLLLWYKKQISEFDTRHKYILYPLTSVYETLTIEKWIVDTNSEYFKEGYKYVCAKYWRLDVYSEKTVVYNKKIFEGEYVPQLCAVWEVINKCNEIQSKGEDVAKYIEEMEKTKGSPFYNENKRKKKIVVDEDSCENEGSSKTSKIFNTSKYVDFELDF